MKSPMIFLNMKPMQVGLLGEVNDMSAFNLRLLIGVGFPFEHSFGWVVSMSCWRLIMWFRIRVIDEASSFGFLIVALEKLFCIYVLKYTRGYGSTRIG